MNDFRKTKAQLIEELKSLRSRVTTREQLAGNANALQGSEILQAIFAAASVGLCYLDTDLKFVFINEFLADINGLPVEQHVGRKFSEVLPDVAAQVESQLRRVIATGKPILKGTIVTETATSPNVKRHLQYDFLPVKSADATVVGIKCVVQNITERNRTKNALRESESHLQAILDASVDPIITIDERGIVETANPAVTRLLGFETDELIGRNVKMIMPEPFESEHDAYIDHFLKTGEKRVIGIGREVLGLRKDGTVFPVHLAVSEMQIDNSRFFCGVLRDISDLKQAEWELRQQTKQLEAANAELEDFAYVVSHDLKAPLRGINMLADWIATDYADLLDAEGQNHLALLMERTSRMDLLIDGILKYSRIGRQALELEQIDSHKLVRETIDAMHPPENISILIVDSLPWVEYDRIHLLQLFQNLIGNAVQHLGKPSGEVWVSCCDGGEFWEFSVRDNGVGIEEKYLKKIFKMFETLTEHGESKSTGIGLALVKKIIEQHGGSIRVKSVPKEGSEFVFTIRKSERPA